MTPVPNISPATPVPHCAIRVREVDANTVVVAADGELDLASAPELKWTILEWFEKGHRRVVVDLSGVSFIDSTAIGVLIAIARKLRDGQRLALGGVGPAIRDVFRLAGVERAFRLYPTGQASTAYLEAIGTGRETW